jgi:predicted O-methyltransferase YrrM
MDAAIEAVLAQYHARDARERPIQRSLLGSADYLRRRDEFLLSIGPDTGRFLNILIKSTRAQVILEVGTSYGYSTVWLAEAVAATGGKVFSLELDGVKVEYARHMLRQAGLASRTEFGVGDALASIKAFSRPIDFVLIDLWKELYVPVLDALYPHLAPGALIAADNILLPEQYRELSAAYIEAVKAKPSLETVTVPIGHGIELTRYSPKGKGG